MEQSNCDTIQPKMNMDELGVDPDALSDTTAHVRFSSLATDDMFSSSSLNSEIHRINDILKADFLAQPGFQSLTDPNSHDGRIITEKPTPGQSETNSSNIVDFTLNVSTFKNNGHSMLNVFTLENNGHSALNVSTLKNDGHSTLNVSTLENNGRSTMNVSTLENNVAVVSTSKNSCHPTLNVATPKNIPSNEVLSHRNRTKISYEEYCKRNANKAENIHSLASRQSNDSSGRPPNRSSGFINDIQNNDLWPCSEEYAEKVPMENVCEETQEEMRPISGVINDEIGDAVNSPQRLLKGILKHSAPITSTTSDDLSISHLDKGEMRPNSGVINERIKDAMNSPQKLLKGILKHSAPITIPTSDALSNTHPHKGEMRPIKGYSPLTNVPVTKTPFKTSHQVICKIMRDYDSPMPLNPATPISVPATKQLNTKHINSKTILDHKEVRKNNLETANKSKFIKEFKQNNAKRISMLKRRKSCSVLSPIAEDDDLLAMLESPSDLYPISTTQSMTKSVPFTKQTNTKLIKSNAVLDLKESTEGCEQKKAKRISMLKRRKSCSVLSPIMEDDDLLAMLESPSDPYSIFLTSSTISQQKRERDSTNENPSSSENTKNIDHHDDGTSPATFNKNSGKWYSNRGKWPLSRKNLFKTRENKGSINRDRKSKTLGTNQKKVENYHHTKKNAFRDKAVKKKQPRSDTKKRSLEGKDKIKKDKRIKFPERLFSDDDMPHFCEIPDFLNKKRYCENVPDVRNDLPSRLLEEVNNMVSFDPKRDEESLSDNISISRSDSPVSGNHRDLNKKQDDFGLRDIRNDSVFYNMVNNNEEAYENSLALKRQKRRVCKNKRLLRNFNIQKRNRNIMERKDRETVRVSKDSPVTKCQPFLRDSMKVKATNQGKFDDIATARKCADVATARKCADVATAGKCANVATAGKCDDTATAGKCDIEKMFPTKEVDKLYEDVSSDNIKNTVNVQDHRIASKSNQKYIILKNKCVDISESNYCKLSNTSRKKGIRENLELKELWKNLEEAQLKYEYSGVRACRLTGMPTYKEGILKNEKSNVRQKVNLDVKSAQSTRKRKSEKCSKSDLCEYESKNSHKGNRHMILTKENKKTSLNVSLKEVNQSKNSHKGDRRMNMTKDNKKTLLNVSLKEVNRISNKPAPPQIVKGKLITTDSNHETMRCDFKNDCENLAQSSKRIRCKSVPGILPEIELEKETCAGFPVVGRSKEIVKNKTKGNISSKKLTHCPRNVKDSQKEVGLLKSFHELRSNKMDAKQRTKSIITKQTSNMENIASWRQLLDYIPLFEAHVGKAIQLTENEKRKWPRNEQILKFIATLERMKDEEANTPEQKLKLQAAAKCAKGLADLIVKQNGGPQKADAQIVNPVIDGGEIKQVPVPAAAPVAHSSLASNNDHGHPFSMEMQFREAQALNQLAANENANEDSFYQIQKALEEARCIPDTTTPLI